MFTDGTGRSKLMSRVSAYFHEEENHCSCWKGSITINVPQGTWLVLWELCHLEGSALLITYVKL